MSFNSFTPFVRGEIDSTASVAAPAAPPCKIGGALAPNVPGARVAEIALVGDGTGRIRCPLKRGCPFGCARPEVARRTAIARGEYCILRPDTMKWSASLGYSKEEAYRYVQKGECAEAVLISESRSVPG